MDPYALALLPKPLPSTPLVPIRLFSLCGSLMKDISPQMVGLRLELIPDIQAFIHLLRQEADKHQQLLTDNITDNGTKVDGSAFSRPTVRFSGDHTEENKTIESPTASSENNTANEATKPVFNESVARKIIAILRRVQTHIGIYNVNTGTLLSTGTGRGNAEIVALPTTINASTFHSPVLASEATTNSSSASPTHDTIGRSASPPPNNTGSTRPPSAKAGTATSGTKTPNANAHDLHSPVPAVSFAHAEPIVPEWVQRADNYFHWTDTVRNHIRNTVAIQEASILNDAQFILQANILVPNHFVPLITLIPWRLAVCGPLLKSHLTSPAAESATTAPPAEPVKGGKEAAKAPAKGKTGKEEPAPAPAPVIIPKPTGLLPSPSIANDSPLKLWYDDRIPRIAQSIRNAIMDCNNITVIPVDTSIMNHGTPTSTLLNHQDGSSTNKKVIPTIAVPVPENLRAASSLHAKGIILPSIRDDIAAPLVNGAIAKRAEIDALHASKAAEAPPAVTPSAKGGKATPAPAKPTGKNAAPVEEVIPPTPVEVSPFISLTRNQVNEILMKQSQDNHSNESVLSNEEITLRNEIAAIGQLSSPYVPTKIFPSIVTLTDIHNANTQNKGTASGTSTSAPSTITLPSILTGVVPTSSSHPETTSYTLLRQTRRNIAKSFANSRMGIISTHGHHQLNYGGNGLYHHLTNNHTTNNKSILTGKNLIHDTILGNEEVYDPTVTDPAHKTTHFTTHNHAIMYSKMIVQNNINQIGQDKLSLKQLSTMTTIKDTNDNNNSTPSTASVPVPSVMNTTLQLSSLYNQAIHNSLRREQISRLTLLHDINTVDSKSITQKYSNLPMTNISTFIQDYKDSTELRDTYKKYQTYQDIKQAAKLLQEKNNSVNNTTTTVPPSTN